MTRSPASCERPPPRARRRRSGPVVVLAGVLACTFATAGEAERLQSPTSSAHVQAFIPGSFDVLVWNVHKGRSGAWADEYRRLSRDAELVLLQEIYGDREMEAVLAESAPSWRRGVSFFFVRPSRRNQGAREQRRRLATGVATGSTVEAVEARVEHSPQTEPLTSTPKAALLTWYPIGERRDTLLVINVHAINYRSSWALRAQLGMLEPAIAEHEGPVLLAGDFNTRNARRLRIAEEIVQRLGLAAALPIRARDGRTRVAGSTLDHVFVRGLEVREARVLAIGRASDHAAIWLQLRIPASDGSHTNSCAGDSSPRASQRRKRAEYAPSTAR